MIRSLNETLPRRGQAEDWRSGSNPHEAAAIAMVPLRLFILVEE